MMRIIQIVATADEEASGPTYSVSRLATSLSELGDDVRLLSLSRKTHDLRQISDIHTSWPRDFGRTPGLRSLLFSRNLAQELRREARISQIFHSHGLWLMPNIYPARAVHRTTAALIVSPRGTFSPVALARSRLRKRLFWAAMQKGAVLSARCLHATSEQEFLDIRAFGLKQPVAVIPNGIDLPDERPRVQGERRRLLYLGRIHPIKGLEVLLQAWAQVEPEFPDWDLKLVGPDEAQHEARLRRLAQDLRLKRVTFAGPRYGEDKQAEYRAADLYVLPSFTENFGISVAEALAAGAPVVTTTGTPWRDLKTKGCGWWVAPNVAELAAALREAFRMPPIRLAAMGEAGRGWMQTEFSWGGVARRMQATYRWMCGVGDRPADVRTDE